MKKYLFLGAILLGAGGLVARDTGASSVSGLKSGRAMVAQAPSASDAAKKDQLKAAEQDDEDTSVIIDSKSGDADSETLSSSASAAAEHQEETAFDSSIPASYGQFKGVMAEQGRNVLVFENEDGVLGFVQISVARNSVNWKLLARVSRSQD